MERSKETTVTIAELSQKERANSEAAAQEIITALKENASTIYPKDTQTEILNPAPDEIKTIPGIQILTNPLIVNDGKKGSVNDAKTWKEATEKRKGDKKR